MKWSPLLLRCIRVASKEFRPSPRVERYLVLICGLIILGVTCRLWFSLQSITTDLDIWSGPTDPYLMLYRPSVAWLWNHDHFGITLMAWAMVGLVALGPFTSEAWRNRSWPTFAWGSVTLAACCAYIVLGLTLMMLPLGWPG